MISVSVKTGRSAAALCEIGEQGGLTTDGGLVCTPPGRKADLRVATLLTFQEFLWEFMDELQPSGRHRRRRFSEA